MPRRERNAFLRAFGRLEAAGERKRQLVPQHLATLQTTPVFTAAVAEEAAAREAWIAAGRAYCLASTRKEPAP